MGNWLTGADEQDYANASGVRHDPNQSLYNIPGLSGHQDYYNNAQNGGLNVAANMGQQDSDYGRQGQAADMMYQQALGNGPSIANEQMKQGLAQADRNIQSAALSHQAGLAPGLTQRNLLNAQAGMDSGVIGQGGLQRATEQLGAMQGLGNMATNMRAGSQARTGQQMGQDQFNVGTKMGAADRSTALDVNQGNNNMAYDQAQTNAGDKQYGDVLNTANANYSAVGRGIGRAEDIANKGAGIFSGLM